MCLYPQLPTFMKHKRNGASPCLQVYVFNPGSSLHLPRPQLECVAGVCKQLRLDMLKYGAPGLSCNQGIYLSTSTVFDLLIENSHSDC